MKGSRTVWDVSRWVCALACVPPLLLADITTDGSLGNKRQLNGPDYAIPSTLGRVSGTNLFHSFDLFNIRSGETATFSGPGNIANVISRVTGGTASNIDGTLRSTMPQADVWMINPAGIAFGPNARLDVKGSFHASTAQSVKFTDGTEFRSDTKAQPVLTTAAPAAFGFLNKNSAPLTVRGSQLAVSSSHDLTLAGGNVRIDGGASLSGSHIKVSSQGSPGQANVGPVVEVSAGTRQGATVIKDANLTGSTISIRSGRLQTSNSILKASGASSVNLLTHQDVTLGADTQVRADGSSGGKINVQSEQGTTTVAGELTAKGSKGTGGKIDILGRQVRLTTEALVDVTGQRGGGSVHVGGGFHGENAQLPNALTTEIQQGATIRADAGHKNNGGRVVVWSDNQTRFSGKISSRGGAEGGDGGFAEVSGKKSLQYEGSTDLKAWKGANGRLLLDPDDVRIGSLSAPTITLSVLKDQLRLSNVEITTSGNGTDAGDITFGASFDSFDYDTIGTSTLTLKAHNNIQLNTRVFDSNTSSDVLNLTLMADSDKSGTGKPNVNGGAVSVEQRFNQATLALNGILTISGDEANIKGSISSFATGAPSGIVFRDLDKLTIGSSEVDNLQKPITVTTTNAGSFSPGNILFQNIRDLAIGKFVVGDFGSLPFQPNFAEVPLGVPVVLNTTTSGSGQGGSIRFVDIGQLTVKSGAAPSPNNFNSAVQVTTQIATTTAGSGAAGDLRFQNVSALRVEGGDINSITSGTGPSGAIIFDEVPELSLVRQTGSGEVLVGFGSGTINSNLNIDVGANIRTDKTAIASGRVNPVDFTNVGKLTVDRGVISSGGNIGFDNVSHLIVKGGDNSGAITTETNSVADAGALSFNHIGRLDLLSGGTIASNSTNPNGFKSVTETGNAGNITFTDIGTLTVGSNSQIRSRTQGGTGDAGTITFNDVGRLILKPVENQAGLGGTISTSSTSYSDAAKAGNIVMNGIGVLDVDGGQINSRTLGKGPAGTIALRQINSVAVHNAGVIRTDTTGPGNAGRISIATTGTGKNTFASDSVNARSALTPAALQLYPLNTLRVYDNGSISSKSALSADTPDVFCFRNDATKLGAAGSIRLTAGNINVKNAGSISVVTDSQQVTKTSKIRIDANRLSLNNGDISAATTGRTDAGNIALHVDTLQVSGGGRISGSSTSQDRDAGKAGAINIAGRTNAQADNVILRNGSLLTTATEGPGGRISVQSKNIGLSRNTSLSAEVSGQFSPPKPGRRADVALQASDSILVDQASVSASTRGNRTGGSVTLNSPLVTVRNSGTVKVTTSGAGNAGSVNVVSDTFLVDTHGNLSSSSSSSGDAGTVNVRTNVLTMRDGATISSNSTATSSGAGNAGAIIVSGPQGNRATAVTLNGSSLSTTARRGGGGTIRMDTAQLVLDQAQVSVAVKNNNGTRSGTKADITINADQLFVQDQSRILATTSGSRPGGNVNLTGTDVSLSDRASVSAGSTGTGRAGTINVTATNRFLSDNSTVSTQSSSADGGNINFNVDLLMRLLNSSITTSVAGGAGRGGNIIDNTTFLALDNSTINANAFGGPGGNINISADFFFRPDNSVVSASSQLSTPGTVVGNTPDRSLSGNLRVLPTNFLNAAALMRERCGRRVNVGRSTFSVRGRGGLPPTPGEPITLPVEFPEAASDDQASNLAPQAGELALDNSPCLRQSAIEKNMTTWKRYN